MRALLVGDIQRAAKFGTADAGLRLRRDGELVQPGPIAIIQGRRHVLHRRIAAALQTPAQFVDQRGIQRALETHPCRLLHIQAPQLLPIDQKCEGARRIASGRQAPVESDRDRPRQILRQRQRQTAVVISRTHPTAAQRRHPADLGDFPKRQPIGTHLGAHARAIVDTHAQRFAQPLPPQNPAPVGGTLALDALLVIALAFLQGESQARISSGGGVELREINRPLPGLTASVVGGHAYATDDSSHLGARQVLRHAIGSLSVVVKIRRTRSAAADSAFDARQCRVRAIFGSRTAKIMHSFKLVGGIGGQALHFPPDIALDEKQRMRRHRHGIDRMIERKSVNAYSAFIRQISFLVKRLRRFLLQAQQSMIHVAVPCDEARVASHRRRQCLDGGAIAACMLEVVPDEAHVQKLILMPGAVEIVEAMPGGQKKIATLVGAGPVVQQSAGAVIGAGAGIVRIHDLKPRHALGVPRDRGIDFRPAGEVSERSVAGVAKRFVVEKFPRLRARRRCQRLRRADGHRKGQRPRARREHHRRQRTPRPFVLGLSIIGIDMDGI